MIFVDASAFFACLYGDDEDHPDAVSVWRELAESDVDLVTTNYVVVETLALIQRKAGAAVARMPAAARPQSRRAVPSARAAMAPAATALAG